MQQSTQIIGLVVLILVGIGLGMFLFRDNVPEDTHIITSTEQETQHVPTETQPETLSLAIDSMETQEFTQATFTTNKGTIVLELYADRTPVTVANFAKLAASGFYNGTRFHRVIEGFMIQGGDPQSKDMTLQDRWGTGGPGYTFDDEITPENKNDIGTISMANAGPNTNGSQFFINVANNNFLDTKHTVFGKVVQGMDVVIAISNIGTDGRDRPVDEVIVESVVVK